MDSHQQKGLEEFKKELQRTKPSLGSLCMILQDKLESLDYYKCKSEIVLQEIKTRFDV